MSKHKTSQESKKGKPTSAGSRKHKIAAYYEVRYPEKKLRRMVRNGCTVAQLRAWADAYKSPSGVSANGSLVKLAREFNLNVSQQ